METPNSNLLAALAALLVTLIPLIRAWVQTKLTPQRLANVAQLAHVAVSAAEKLGEANEALSNDEKYAVAEAFLNNAAKKLGIKLTVDELNGYIHAALREMQQVEGDMFGVGTPGPAPVE